MVFYYNIYDYNVNISLIILYIIIDVFGLLNLWNENFYRRIIHHIQSHVYNKNKKPWIINSEIKLSNNQIEFIKEVSENTKKEKGANTLTKYISNLGIGAHYSKKSSLYYNDFDNETQKKLDIIGNELKVNFEKNIGKKLFLGTSNFRCCILRYEGNDSNFGFHYDTEETNCYRCIFLFHKRGIISPFCYYDNNGIKQKINFNIGEGIFFKGTKTYHGVEINNDPNSQRYIVGWQYSTDLSVKSKSLCSELRDKDLLYIFKIFIFYIGTINFLNYFWTNYIINIPIGFNIIFINNGLLCILTLFLPKYLPKYIGTGLYFDMSKLIVFMLLTLITNINSPQNGFILSFYLLSTEMFLPNYIIGKTLI